MGIAKSVIMKLLLTLSLIAAASAAEIKYRAYKMEPSSTIFQLVEERSATGGPSVTVTFPDGYTDTLVFSRYYSTEEDRMAETEACHYIGHLANELEACAAMTGCVGKEDVEFTIMSKHAPESGMFKWTKDGKVEIIESTFKKGKGESRVLMRGGTDDDGWGQDLDELENAGIANAEKEIEELCSGGASCANVPATNLLQIRAGYDDGFFYKVGGSAAAAEAYIKSTMPHIQVFYCHASLGTKIHVQLLDGIKHYQGRSLQATGDKLKEMWSTTTSDLGSADLMMYMGYENEYYGVVGIAWGKVVCEKGGDHYKESINEWRKTHAEAGQLIAHEMGHNLGMEHDFTAAHKAAGCNGQGIMSYGDPLKQWSTCSVKDLQAHYLAQKSNWCMDPAPTACDGSGTIPATPAPTAAPPPPETSTCDMTGIFGWSGVNAGNIILTVYSNGQEYVSNISCTNSVCKPNVSGISNACQYMCGSTGTSCP